MKIRNYSSWRQKWIRRWNIVCVKFIAIISFTCIISVILVKSISEDNTDKNNQTYTDKRFQRFEFGVFSNREDTENDCEFSRSSYNDPCYFTCVKKNADLISDSIHIHYTKNACSGGIILILQECYFPQQILEKTWWKNNINVIYLSFESCYFLNIEEGVFESAEFTSTERITFSGSHVHHYKKNVFLGLNSLVDLSIRDSIINSYQGITFEFGVLEPISNSLQILQIQNIHDSTAIKNITGINLPKLISIDFRYNTHLTYIPDDAFKTKNLITLYLSNNNLLDLKENVFKHAPNIANIFLENNKLKNLHKNMFLSFNKHDNITISNNDWGCDCNLKFLTIYKNIKDLQITKCSDGVTFLKDIFRTCEDNNTTTTRTSLATKPSSEDTTTSPTITFSDDLTSTKTSLESKPSSKDTTTSSTTTNPDDALSTPTSFKTEDASISSTSTSKPLIGSCEMMSNKFSVKKIDEQAIITFGENFSSHEYYFFSSNEASCNFKNGNVFVTKPDTTFIICSREKNGSSGLECLSERSPATYEEQVWMKNKAKIPLILSGIAVIVAASILTGFGVFYWIQQYSNTAKVNKRLNFNKPTNLSADHHEFMYMSIKKPREISDVNKRHRFFNPTEGITYLTPIQNTSNLMRSSSDSLKTLASYVTTDQMSWQMYCKKERIPVNNVFDDIPPLPPPRNRYDEIILHENEISHLHNF